MLPDDLSIKDLLARHLAACPDRSVRDGARAVELATELVLAVPTLESLETLAMAHAEAEQFEEAIAWQERLLEEEEARDAAVRARLERHLALYRQGRACCE